MRCAALFLGLGALLLCGDAQARSDQPAAGVGNTAQGYLLSPGDRVRITVFNVPEITGEYALGPTGEIALPLLGSMAVAGLTADHLSETIAGKLAQGYVNNPKITVEVINFRPFYILGEVNHPGEYPYKATITIEQAIAAAGGFTYRAAHKKAFLRRAAGPERVTRLGDEPVYVMPGDTIRIGERYF